MTTPSLADPHAASPLAPHEPDRVARVRLGDQAAFEAMFTEHYRSLCDFVMSMGELAYKLREVSPGTYTRSAPALVMVGHWGLRFEIAPRGDRPFEIQLLDRAGG